MIPVTPAPAAVFLGDFRKVKTRKPRHYFETRWTFMDCRGSVEIAETAHFGFGVRIVSATHRYDPTHTKDELGGMILSIVKIDNAAWIGSHALLYRCHVMHHAIVGAGAVVKGVVVPPYAIVEGNPARIVSVMDEDGRPIKPEHPIEMKRF